MGLHLATVVPPEVPPDVPPDVPPEVPPDVPPEVPPDAPPLLPPWQDARAWAAALPQSVQLAHAYERPLTLYVTPVQVPAPSEVVHDWMLLPPQAGPTWQVSPPMPAPFEPAQAATTAAMTATPPAAVHIDRPVRFIGLLSRSGGNPSSSLAWGRPSSSAPARSALGGRRHLRRTRAHLLKYVAASRDAAGASWRVATFSCDTATSFFSASSSSSRRRRSHLWCRATVLLSHGARLCVVHRKTRPWPA